MKNKNILKEYDLIVDKLADIFIKKYFGKDYNLKDDAYWIGSKDEDREVLAINDYFFSVDRIIDSLRYSASKKKLFDYLEKEIEFVLKNKENKEMEIDFKNYLKLKKYDK